jgi:hypothetical protein
MLRVTAEAVRVSRGLVLWVVAGVTRDWCYWPGVEGLLYRWWDAGGICWRPAYWERHGIPGSGGKQWLRANVEYVLAFAGRRGPIPWADPLANGSPPRFKSNGPMSNRKVDGGRVRGRAAKPGAGGAAVKVEIANPGNVVRVKVGGGHMGHPLATENEAPFPEGLAEFFLKSWCPPGGVVLDPFGGSGTTAAVAARLGRRAISGDIRASQCDLSRRRIGGGSQSDPPVVPRPVRDPSPRPLDLFSTLESEAAR